MQSIKNQGVIKMFTMKRPKSLATRIRREIEDMRSTQLINCATLTKPVRNDMGLDCGCEPRRPVLLPPKLM